MANSTKLRTGPKDVFLQLLGFVAFYATIFSFISLMFQYINVLFKDPLDFYYTGVLNTIRTSTSVLVVMFPVFVLVSWLLEKEFARSPERRELTFRKWLVYLTLFAAAVTIIVTLITLVNNFYSGELTTQFLLKVVTVLAVAAAVFRYYFWDLKRGSGSSSVPRVSAWIASVVVIASVVAGFFIVGSPQEQRNRRFDEERVRDLQSIQSQVINYWRQKERVPQSLAELSDPISGFIPPHDPETEEAYEYNVLGELSFELCATFKTKGDASGVEGIRPRVPLPVSEFGPAPVRTDNWNHDAGRECFERTIDPELYKPAESR